MKKNIDQDSVAPNGSSARFRWMRILLAAGALVILFGLLRIPRHDGPVPTANSIDATRADESVDAPRLEHPRLFSRRIGPAPATTAEEIVASKLSQFTRSRRELARAMAKRKGVAVPGEVERFFDALETGSWPEIEAQFDAIDKQVNHGESSLELNTVWAAVLDAYGAAQEAHEWPAQKLLDYGNAILDSLRPGMVYVGGTDEGRWIPELLNETSGGEPRIIVTQNAMADGRYLDYMNTLYGDRFATLTHEDSKRAFQDYLEDAQKRLAHDQQFPDEPKQIRPGENVSVVDGMVQTSGPVAVMAINEKLLQTMVANNPDLAFAIQESLPLRGTYADALPLGPLMELRAQDGQTTFTAERAAQSLDYWRNATQQIFSDPEAAGSPEVLKSYSHNTVSAANLLAAHNFTAEAEQAYRLAAQFWPGSPASVGGLADLLVRGGREGEARQILGDFNRRYPDQRKDLERISTAWRVLGSAPPGHP